MEWRSGIGGCVLRVAFALGRAAVVVERVGCVGWLDVFMKGKVSSIYPLVNDGAGYVCRSDGLTPLTPAFLLLPTTVLAAWVYMLGHSFVVEESQ